MKRELLQVQESIENIIYEIRDSASIHNDEAKKLSNEEIYFRTDIIAKLREVSEELTRIQIGLINKE